MAVEVIFAIGIGAFLIAYLATRLENKGPQAFLRLLFIGFFFYMLILLGKAAIDESDYCIEFIANETKSEGGNFTAYEYERNCFTNDTNTSGTYYKVISQLFWLFMIYVFVFVIWVVLNWFGKIPKGLGDKAKKMFKGQR